ncbi:MAG TPA: PqiA/YebS family transporter subunit [Steroidobacteraceae bacterium]
MRAHLIGCSDCGLVQVLPSVSADAVAECARCGHGLARPAGRGIDMSLAFSAAALLLLLPTALSPLMSLISFSVQRRSWLPSGVEALWNDGFGPLATVVFLFSIAVPFIYLALMVWVLGALRLGIAVPLGKLFRWAGELRPWAMIEVYLVGCCVAYSRLQDIGTVHVNVGGWCLIAATCSTLLAAISLDERAVWNALPSCAEPASSGRSISCGACALLSDTVREDAACPRCGATLHRRKPDTMRRTLALVVAGYLLYLPANLLPVLSIERFGREDPNTILSGVHELMSSGLWPLAAIVFTASILVPLMKLFGLSLMLVMTRRRSRRWLVGRTRLFRFIDFVGRWSNIDLFMISILVALVQFGALTRVRPEAGSLAFAAVVVITMIASRCFDPRVMWDEADST